MKIRVLISFILTGIVLAIARSTNDTNLILSTGFWCVITMLVILWLENKNE